MTACGPPVRLAVAGAGLIGRRHIEEIQRCPATTVAAVVEPDPAAASSAAPGARWFATLDELLADGGPDGVVLATPNRLHADGALACIAAGVPVLVEKPVADTVAAARQLVDAGEAAGVPVLTGHHRTYSPLMAAARDEITSGRLGRIVAVTGTALFAKPADYFEVGGGWRRQPGGGPILLNLIHEVNNLMTLVGPIVGVQAVTSSAVRGFPVEDTAAMIFTFAGGALGTFLLSDAAASPRSWEQTSRENTSYATFDDEDCYHVAGTRGSLSVPTMRRRVAEGEASWWSPMTSSTLAVDRSDPLAHQIAHFADVVRGTAVPLCSGRDGLRALLVVDAVLEAARTGRPVEVAAA